MEGKVACHTNRPVCPFEEGRGGWECLSPPNAAQWIEEFFDFYSLSKKKNLLSFTKLHYEITLKTCMDALLSPRF